MEKNDCDVIIIGAGLTGLTIAYYLTKAGKNVLVLEKNNRIGGAIKTTLENGFVYEEGPNSGVLSNGVVAQLLEELSPDCEMEMAHELVKKRYVLKNGKWESLPTNLRLAIKTPLFSLSDKFRILAEPFRKAGSNPNETLQSLVKRRLGQSFLDYAVDPFIIGIYAGDPSKLVTKYALPKLYQLEQKYGSFIKGSLKKRKEPKTDLEKKATRKIFSVKGGLLKLIDALVKQIGHEKILLHQTNITIQPIEKEYVVSYFDIQTQQIAYLKTAHVITTVGAYQLPNLLPFLAKEKLHPFLNLEYTKVVEVVLGFEEWRGIPLDGFGGLIPFKEKRDLLGVLFLSACFKDRAPVNGALFSLFMGGVRRQDLMLKTDEELKKIVEEEFTQLMGLEQFNPSVFKLIWHQNAIPQYYADSKERFELVEQIQNQFPGLIIAGNLRNGIGMADRVLQGYEVAQEILKC